MPSLRGPRKPGHSASALADVAGAATSFGASVAGATDAEGEAVVVLAGGAEAVAAVDGVTGRSVDCASSRSSALADQRQPNEAL